MMGHLIKPSDTLKSIFLQKWSALMQRKLKGIEKRDKLVFYAHLICWKYFNKPYQVYVVEKEESVAAEEDMMTNLLVNLYPPEVI